MTSVLSIEESLTPQPNDSFPLQLMAGVMVPLILMVLLGTFLAVCMTYIVARKVVLHMFLNLLVSV